MLKSGETLILPDQNPARIGVQHNSSKNDLSPTLAYLKSRSKASSPFTSENNQPIKFVKEQGVDTNQITEISLEKAQKIWASDANCQTAMYLPGYCIVLTSSQNVCTGSMSTCANFGALSTICNFFFHHSLYTFWCWHTSGMLWWSCGKDLDVDEIHKTLYWEDSTRNRQRIVIVCGVKAMKPGAIFALRW